LLIGAIVIFFDIRRRRSLAAEIEQKARLSPVEEAKLAELLRDGSGS
jgi:hypothetical protein